MRGGRASLEAVWYRNERTVGRAEAGFHVLGLVEVAQSARIALHFLNEPQAHVANAPMTVGAPLPRGALLDERNLRLVDEKGAEVPLQTRTCARWSRFGSIKFGELLKFTGWLTLTHTQRWHAHPRSTGSGDVHQGRFKSFAVQDDDHYYTVCRYVERNALRASLVERAEDCRWGSLYRWSRGARQQKSLLAAWPLPWRPGWIEQVNKPQTKAELAALRRCVLAER